MSYTLVMYDLSDASESDSNLHPELSECFPKPDQTSIEVVLDEYKVVKLLMAEILAKICGEQKPETVFNTVVSSKGKSVGGKFFLDNTGYRDMLADTLRSDNDSDDEYSMQSSCSESDDCSSRKNKTRYDSEDFDCVFSKIVNESRRLKKQKVKPSVPLRTKGELSINDLPKIEDLQISLPETIRLHKLGIVSSVVDTLVIISSDLNVSPLDEDTMLFTEDRNSFGKVYEIFGPVVRPYYAVRFNCAEDARASTARPLLPVYFAPDLCEFTRPVFADSLLQMGKGSDASWTDNNESPAEALDYSDDEQERLAKARQRRAKLNVGADEESISSVGHFDTMSNCTDDELEEKASSKPTTDCHSSAAKRPTTRGRRRRGRTVGRQDSAARTDGTRKNAELQQASKTSINSMDSIKAPWWGNRRAVAPANHSPSSASARNSNDWMWMSEQTFRFPPPRFPVRFGHTPRLGTCECYELIGLENIPDEGPALIVYYHGTLPLDVYYVISKTLLYKKRLLHCVADKFLNRIPGWKTLLYVFCITPGSIESCTESLRNGNLLCISPGGVREALFSDSDSYQLLWNNRLGFAKIAIEAKVSVIPMFTENCREVFRTPGWARRLFRQFYERTRLPLVPVYGGFPVKLCTYLGEPIPYDPHCTPEELRDKVKHKIELLIKSH